MAWPTFGLHVEFDPELFLVLLSRRCCSLMVGKRRPVNFSKWARDFRPRAGAGGGHRGRHCFLIYWVVPGIPLIPAFALARCFLRPML